MNRRHGTHVILGAITPAYDAVDAETLTYPNLRTVLQSQNLPSFVLRHGSEMWRTRFKFSPAELQEDWRTTYLLSAAYHLQRSWSTPGKMFWSTQFTTTSVKLFGRPLSREVASIAADELHQYETLVEEMEIDEDFARPVLEAYRSLLSKRSTPLRPLEERYSYVLAQVHEHYHVTYGECFRIFDAYAPHIPLQPNDIADCFRQALDVLSEQDHAWRKWRVVVNNSSKLSINVNRKQVVVGRRRAPAYIKEVRGLFSHEILVHAQRSVQGAKRGYDLAVGLPNYLAAEEGFGVLVEAAITGSIPNKIKDRYIDIALALGSWNRRPLLRNDMFSFCYTREVLRSIAADEPIDFDLLEKMTWEHVNRIYRGSLGNKYLAVFTKDVSYYRGFVRIAKYLQSESKRGKLATAIAYLNSGKFDPTNPSHTKYVKTLKVLTK